MHTLLVKLLHFTEGQVNLESFILSRIYHKTLQHEQRDIYLWYMVLFYSLKWLVTSEVPNALQGKHSRVSQHFERLIKSYNPGADALNSSFIFEQTRAFVK